MTMEFSYSLPLQGMLSWLILRSSVGSLTYRCFRFQLVPSMKLYWPILWMSLGSSFMLSHKAMSELLPSGLVLCLPHTAGLWRSSNTISGLLIGIVIWFWRGHSFYVLYVPSVCDCLSTCASIFLVLCWRPEMRVVPISLLAAWLPRLFWSQALMWLESLKWRFKIYLANRPRWSPMPSWGVKIRLKLRSLLLFMLRCLI
jgi:hypothetical protein